MRKAFPLNGNGDGGAEPFLHTGAVPIGSLLPAVYQEYDENALRFTAGLDGVLASGCRSTASTPTSARP